MRPKINWKQIDWEKVEQATSEKLSQVCQRLDFFLRSNQEYAGFANLSGLKTKIEMYLWVKPTRNRSRGFYTHPDSQISTSIAAVIQPTAEELSVISEFVAQLAQSVGLTPKRDRTGEDQKGLLRYGLSVDYLKFQK